MRLKFSYLGALALTCILMLTAVPEAQALSGAGIEVDPYLISSPADLAAMHDDLDGVYRLTADLDLTGTAFTPIGNESEGAFSGTLDGNGHAISNLTLDLSGIKYVGLFGYLEGEVCDLTLADVAIQGGRYVGGVAGYAAEGASLSGCAVTSGTVTATGAPTTVACGGVVGCSAGSVTDCSNGAAVSASDGSYTTTVYTGGVAGRSEGSLTLTNCTNSGAVRGVHHTGGFVGYAAGTAVFADCTNSGAVSGANNTTDTSVGGFVGYAGSGVTLSGCTNTGAVFANSTLLPRNAYSGGLIGRGSPARMDSCENAGTVTVRVAFQGGYGYANGTGYAGGLAGECGTIATGCTNSGAVYASPGYPYEGNYIIGGLFAQASGGATDCVNTGAVGNSYTDTVGGITASGSGTYLRCENRGALTTNSTGTTGGILGSPSSSPTFTDCVNYVDLSGYKLGGIVGGSAACVGCKNYGDLAGSFGAGGILYGVYGSATSCLNTGDLSGNWGSSSAAPPVSGIGGRTTTNCVNLGALSGRSWNCLYDMGYGTSTGGVSIANLPSTATRSAAVSITPFEVKINGLVCTDLGTWSQGTVRSLAQLQDSANPAYANWGIGSSWLMEAGVNSGLPRPAGIPADYLNQSVLFLERGATSQLTASFSVSSWESSNGSVASCSDGTVSALLPGRAVISAYSADGRRANCVVFVYDRQSSFALSQSTLSLTRGGSTRLTSTLPSTDPQGILWSSSAPAVASVTPDPYDGSIAWTSSDPDVATVEGGVVTGVVPGTAVISALSDTGIRGTCTVTVIHPAATALSLDRTRLTLELGLTDQLTAILTPAQTSSAVTWASTNHKVVTVDKNGVLTPVAVGQAAVMATANGLTASCSVTVINASVLAESVTLSQTQLRPAVGEKIQLTAALSPADVTDTALIWNSSNHAVATVSTTGVVEAVAPGTAEITVTTTNGLYDVCTVKVSAVSSAAFVADSVRVPADGTADAAIHIVKNPGIAAFSVTVTYDPARMTPAAVAAEELLAGGTLTSNVDAIAEPGKLHLTWYSDSDLTESGPAFTITWAGQEAGTGTISLTYEKDNICNSEEVNVGFQVEAGTAEVIDYLLGDIHRDGAVNMKDIVCFARWFNNQEELDETQQLAADLHWDQSLDAKDLTALAQLLSQTLPEEEPVLLSLVGAEATEPYHITVADTEVNPDGTALVAVTGKSCPGIAAFRFRLEIPEGYEVTDVTAGAVLPDRANFTYNAASGIAFWYTNETTALEDGTLFTIALRSTLAEAQEDTLSLHYTDADFFRAEDYTSVPILASAGTLSRPKAVTIASVQITSSGVTFSLDGNMTGSAQTIVAFYKDGALCGLTMDAVDLGRDAHTVQVTLPADADTCTVFLLKNTGHTPLCGQKSVRL